MNTISSSTNQYAVDRTYDEDDSRTEDLKVTVDAPSAATLTQTMKRLGRFHKESRGEKQEKVVLTGLSTEMTIAIVVASAFLIVAALVLWTIIDRKRHKKDTERMGSELEHKRKRKKRRKRRRTMKRGPKPVIPVKPSKKLKQALSEFLELQTETFASTADDDFSAAADEGQSRPSGLSESRDGKRAFGGHFQSDGLKSKLSNTNVRKKIKKKNARLYTD